MLPMVMINIAEVCHATGDLDGALAAVDRCLEVMRAHDIRHPYLEMSVDRIRGLCAWYGGRKDEAWVLLEAALRSAERCGSADKRGVEILVDYLAIVDGRPRGSAAGAPPPRPGRRSENRLAYLAKEAWRTIEEGDPHAGGAFLAELLDTASATGCVPWTITGHLMAAFCADQEGALGASRQHLAAGLRLLDGIGWRTYPMASPRLSSFAYARSVRWGEMAASARRLIGADNVWERALAFARELESAAARPDEVLGLLAAAAADHIRGLTEVVTPLTRSSEPAVAAAAAAYLDMARQADLPALTIRMLGGFSVTAGGMSVVFRRKKSRSLLQMLLIEHPAPVHEEVILEALWPEGEPAKGRAALQSAVKDLRQALDPHHEPRGNSYVVYDDGHYELHLPDGSTCDGHLFPESVRRALAATAGRASLSESDEAALAAGLALFGGEALPEQRLEPWAQEFRERLHRQFLDATLRLARSLHGRGRCAGAIRALERGLALDPIWGEGVEELMLARAHNGELCRALRVYREYERSLRQDLDLAPDPELKRSFENLLLTAAAAS